MPLSLIVLILFLIIAGFFLWYGFCIIYHFIRFGIGASPKKLSLLFFVSSCILLAVFTFVYFRIDWQSLLNLLLNFSKI